MSTYDNPYVYINRDYIAPVTNTNDVKSDMVNDLRGWFGDGGWDTTGVKKLIKVETVGKPVFNPCLLGSDNDIFFGAGFGTFGYTVVFDELSCFPDNLGNIGNQDEPPETKCMGAGDPSGLTPPNISNYFELKARNPATALPGIIVSADWDSVDAQTWHLTIIGIILGLADEMNLASLIVVKITNPVAGTWITYIEMGEDDPLPVFGNQLVTTVSTLGGVGFIATSQENIVEDNYIEVYVYYEDYVPVNASRSNQIRFATLPGQRFSTCGHPLLEHFETNGDDDSQQIGLTAIDQLTGFIGPYWFALDTASDTSDDTRGCAVWGGAARIKRLDGETAEPKIRKGLFLAGKSGAYSSGSPQTFKLNPGVIPDRTFFWGEYEDPGGDIETVAFWSTNVYISLAGYSNTSNIGTAYDTGINWYGDVACIFEPWFGLNWVDPTNASAYAPLLFQIPNCIHIWRRLDQAIPPDYVDSFFGSSTVYGDSKNIFTWDGKLWKYYMQNFSGISGASQPGMSTAFVVGSSRVLGGDWPLGYWDPFSPFLGLKTYTVESADLASDTILSGGSTTVSITVDNFSDPDYLRDGGLVIIRSDNKRISFSQTIYEEYDPRPEQVVEFPPNFSNVDVTITDNDLGIAEIINIYIIGGGQTTVLQLEII